MDNLNLDIDTYTPTDLKNLFSLSNTFNEFDVINEKNTLLMQLMKMKNINTEKQRQIIFFIDSASNKLMQISKNNTVDKNEGTWMQHYNSTINEGSHFIIENQNTIAGKKSNMYDGRTSGSDATPPGFLNPINVKSISRGLNIDSRFRDNYFSTSSHNFVVNLPDPYKKITSLRIGTIDMPMTMYSVTKQNGDTTMLIKTLDPSFNDIIIDGTYKLLDNPSEPTDITINASSNIIGSRAWLITIPDGIYEIDWQDTNNAADIIITMNNAIALAKPGYTLIDGRFLYDASGPYLNPSEDICYNVDRSTGKSIYSTPSGATSTNLSYGFELLFNVGQSGFIDLLSVNIQLRLGWKLGFRVGSYTSANNINNTAFSIISESICAVMPPRYIFISIDDGQKNQGNSLLAAYSQSTLDKNIMTRINYAATMDGVGVFKCASDAGLSNQLNRTREYFGPVNINRLHIQLFDEYGRHVNLNGMDWSMMMVFEQLYD